jgi:hypothetical protein
LHCGIAINHVNRFRLSFFGNGRNLACKLFELMCADRARGVDDDDDGADALPED